MTDFPWLTALGAGPARRRGRRRGRCPRGRDLLAKQVALAFSLVAARPDRRRSALQFDADGAARSSSPSRTRGSRQFGVSYALGVDGIALVLIALAAVLIPVCILASWHDAEQSDVGDRQRSVTGFFALLLVLEASWSVVFAATDVFLFYISSRRCSSRCTSSSAATAARSAPYAAVKFLLYSLLGGLLMLAAVIGLYVVSDGGPQAFLFENAARRRHRHRHRALAVPRLLHRVRDQGAAVAGAHLAAGRRGRVAARRRGAARRRARQGRHLRHARASACRCSRTRRSGPRRWSSCWP